MSNDDIDWSLSDFFQDLRLLLTSLSWKIIFLNFFDPFDFDWNSFSMLSMFQSGHTKIDDIIEKAPIHSLTFVNTGATISLIVLIVGFITSCHFYQKKQTRKAMFPSNYSHETQAKFEAPKSIDTEPSCSLTNPSRNLSDLVVRDYGDKK